MVHKIGIGDVLTEAARGVGDVAIDEVADNKEEDDDDDDGMVVTHISAMRWRLAEGSSPPSAP